MWTRKNTRAPLSSSVLYTLLAVVAVIAFQLLLNPKLWSSIVTGDLPRGWDGSAHYAIAQIYSQTVFPETFGWTHAYFGGMPVPNFYPPLFYWITALLAPLLGFDVAFKAILSGSVLLQPLCVGFLTYRLSGKNSWSAGTAALFAIVAANDARLRLPASAGLDNISTFGVGLYTQPLGFDSLLLWLAVFLAPRPNVSLSAILLGTTVLANFFAGCVGAVIALTIMSVEFFIWVRDRSGKFVRRAGANLLAFGLTLFWSVPIFSAYEFFVTKPSYPPIHEVITFISAIWAGTGLLAAIYHLSLSRKSGLQYLSLACLVFGGVLALSWLSAPRWFPFQPSRLVVIWLFLLIIPVASSIGNLLFQHVRMRAAALAVMSVLLFATVRPASTSVGFFNARPTNPIYRILEFAKEHNNGRYLIEFPLADGPLQFDARALTSYLGMQSNESAVIAFHESSPNSLFFLPTMATLSSSEDYFGVSSMLAGDGSFLQQNIEKHLLRARHLGISYVVATTPWINKRLFESQNAKKIFAAPPWAVWAISGPAAKAIVASRKPILVVDSSNLKLRSPEEVGYTHLAELQFLHASFDPPLAQVSEDAFVRLETRDLAEFSAVVVILRKQPYRVEFMSKLREATGLSKVSVVVADDLADSILRHIADLNVSIISGNSFPSGRGRQLSDNFPQHVWHAISAKSFHSERTPLPNSRMIVAVTSNSIEVQMDDNGKQWPLIIKTTYHPAWVRTDGKPIYAASPFFMFTFVEGSATLRFERSALERVAAAVSVSCLLGCLLATAGCWWARR